MPYPAEGYENATVSGSGCGPTAMATALQSLGIDRANAKNTASMSILGGARVAGGTSMHTLCAIMRDRWGVSWRETSALSELLSHSGPAIAHCAGNGMFSTGGHFICVLRALPEAVLIADPGWYAGKYDPVRRPLRSAVTDLGRGLLLASPKVLHDDCEGRSPRYYLLSKRT